MKGINHKYVELLKSTFKKYEKIDVIEKPMKPAEDVKLVVESAPDKIETIQWLQRKDQDIRITIMTMQFLGIK